MKGWSLKTEEILRIKPSLSLPKRLPINKIADLFIAEDEATVANISKFEEIFNSSVQSAVEERLKSNGYNPPQNNSNRTTA